MFCLFFSPVFFRKCKDDCLRWYFLCSILRLLLQLCSLTTKHITFMLLPFFPPKEYTACIYSTEDKVNKDGKSCKRSDTMHSWRFFLLGTQEWGQQLDTSHMLCHQEILQSEEVEETAGYSTQTHQSVWMSQCWSRHPPFVSGRP